MSERGLRLLLTVLGVLVVAWVAVSVRWGGILGGEDDLDEMEALLGALDVAEVRAISFSDVDGSEEVRLVRNDLGRSRWTVEGHPVDSTRITLLLQVLRALSTGGVVSVNPENHARMELDESGARRMALEREGGADTLLLGKGGPTTTSVYARLPGRAEVHLLEGWLRPHATREIQEWRSRRVASVDTSVVVAVEVQRGGAAYRLERSDSAWTVDGDPADASSVRALMAGLSDLRAGGFPADTVAANVVDADAGTAITVWSGDATELLVVRIREVAGAEESDATAVVQGPAALQAGVPFTVSRQTVERLAPDEGEIRDGSSPGGA